MVDKKKSTDEQKKRGRKPRGGKIVECNDNTVLNINTQILPNIILHLMCGLKDLNPINENNYYIKEEKMERNKENENKNNINDKLNELKLEFKNNTRNKISACFWCTYSFNNYPIYIPKNIKNNQYEVYGCFCSPECATGYLINEKIDTSIISERYQLLNFLYGKIYNYNENIKPAPNPHYFLDKYYGNLTIDEYRTLSQKGKTFLVINKPITCILPELLEDNNKPQTDTNLLYSR